jgi:hypothetical protein
VVTSKATIGPGASSDPGEPPPTGAGPGLNRRTQIEVIHYAL